MTEAKTQAKKTKADTKSAQLVTLLKTKTGADVAALSEKLGWQTHTVRAALTRLKQAGYPFEKTKTGTPPRTFYRITGEAAGSPS